MDSWSAADTPVDRLPQEVEMTAVPCGFLDHVQHREAKREVHVVTAGRIAVGMNYRASRMCTLLDVARHDRGERVVGLAPEVAVQVVVGSGPGHIEVGEVDAEPEPFRAGEVLEPGWPGSERTARPPRGRLGVSQAGHLVHHGRTVEVEHALQHRPLGAALERAGTRHRRHVGHADTIGPGNPGYAGHLEGRNGDGSRDGRSMIRFPNSTHGCDRRHSRYLSIRVTRRCPALNATEAGAGRPNS